MFQQHPAKDVMVFFVRRDFPRGAPGREKSVRDHVRQPDPVGSDLILVVEGAMLVPSGERDCKGYAEPLGDIRYSHPCYG